MFLLGQDNMDQDAAAGGGLEFNLPFTLGALWGIVITDAVQDLEYQLRPYEVRAGDTEKAARESIEYLYEVFRKRPRRGAKWASLAWHLTTPYFVNAMKEVRRRFDAVEVDRLRVKPTVKITGEFYLQTVEGDPNYNIHRWLEAEGAEVYPAAIAVWFDYLMRLAGQDFEDHFGIQKHARLKFGGIRAGQAAPRWIYGRVRRALGGVPHAMPDQYALRRRAAADLRRRPAGRAGHVLVATT